MKKLVCAALAVIVIFSFCSCSELPTIKKLNSLLMSELYIDWDNYSSAELSAGSRYKYYFGTLSENQKKAYNNILKELTEADDSFPEKIQVPLMESEELTQVYEAIAYDNPEIMCFGSGASIITEGELCFFKPDYTMIPAEMKHRAEALSQKADEICSYFTAETSDFDKELAIHDYIIKNCDYNCETEDSSTAYACIFLGYASCEGYAKAMKYLLEKADIENICIIGDATNQQGESESHMWNIVNIGGAYYHLDTTWDDPAQTTDGISHIYFNLTDDEIKTDHSGFYSDYVCDSTDENYFVKTGRVFSGADYYSRQSMQSEIIENLEKNQQSIQFRFSSAQAFSNAVYTLITESVAYDIQNNIRYLRPDLPLSDEINYSKNENYNIIEFIF